MLIYFLDLPGWHFDASEVAAGSYRIAAVYRGETRLEKVGADTSELLAQCRQDAAALPRGESLV